MKKLTVWKETWCMCRNQQLNRVEVNGRIKRAERKKMGVNHLKRGKETGLKKKDRRRVTVYNDYQNSRKINTIKLQN